MIDCHQEHRCIYAFERVSARERIVAVFNFSDKVQKGYHFKVENAAALKRLFSSNQDIYGGNEKKGGAVLKAKAGEFTATLAPYSAEYYLAG